MIELYKNIRKLREEKGLSQDELAKLTGYTSRSSITKIEKGEVDLTRSKIIAFAQALGTTPGNLMGWDNDTPTNWKPTLNEKEHLDIAKEVESILNGLDADTAISFDGEAISDTTKELLRKSLENTLETARLVAKEKYTPKKYRK
ncbi:MAG: helix-turn-helix domain-containing protein [Firmicutes bacterium]|nr:helix-turn-helix domain-containing protein [Bacillota bacterium]